MRIKELKINGFGKLENKDIKLTDNINVIYGENEAGKSTLLKFITGMFYGLSRNKNGQSISDFERFTPWKTEDFSGKIKYELDNNNTFEVYRDFKKKNPIIYNENLEDISKKFNIDKTKGNQFFYDQIVIEEEIFNSSVITKQTEVKLDEKSQNSIIQKVSNILGTGEDNTSYNSVVSKLKKKLMEEVGTENSKERPINLVNKKIEEIQKVKLKLKEFQHEKFKVEEILQDKKTKVIEEKERLETLRLANIKIEKAKAEETKINVVKKLVEDTEDEIKNFKQKNKAEDFENSIKIKKRYYMLSVLACIISILVVIFINKIFLKIIPIVITVVVICISILQYKKEKAKIKEKKKEYKEELRMLENKKEMQEKELKNIENKQKKEIQDICQRYSIKDINTVIEEISKIESKINELTLSIHTTELDNQNIVKKLETYVKLEEELESSEEEKKELEKKRYEIQKALDVLEIAYNKMKEQITPKFTEKLSKTITKISNGKYKNVRMSIQGDIIVEDVNGEYINAENLSIGTIDQLYLSLRLASIEKITKEQMPIILDESFAYYDNERLKNILKYLKDEYNENQIIIFTCTKREIEELDNLGIEFNLIEL